MTYVDVNNISDADLNELKTYYFGENAKEIKLTAYQRKNDFIWDGHKNGRTTILFEAPYSFYETEYRNYKFLQENLFVKSSDENIVVFYANRFIFDELAKKIEKTGVKEIVLGCMHSYEPEKSAEPLLIVSGLIIFLLLISGIITLRQYLKKRENIDSEFSKICLEKSDIILSTFLFLLAIPAVLLLEYFAGDVLLFDSTLDLKQCYFLIYLLVSSILSILCGYFSLKKRYEILMK